MSQALCVEDTYACVERWHAHDGEVIYPGMKLLDLVIPAGTSHTLKANSWGILVISDRNDVPDEHDMPSDVVRLASGQIIPITHGKDVGFKAGTTASRQRDAWGIAAYTAGFKTFYQGPDEISAERKAANVTGTAAASNRVYAQGDYLCQVMPHDKRGTAKSATPHPSTSRSVSNAKAEGRLLPSYG